VHVSVKHWFYEIRRLKCKYGAFLKKTRPWLYLKTEWFRLHADDRLSSLLSFPHSWICRSSAYFFSDFSPLKLSFQRQLHSAVTSSYYFESPLGIIKTGQGLRSRKSRKYSTRPVHEFWISRVNRGFESIRTNYQCVWGHSTSRDSCLKDARIQR
jgi:hypothetical protein